MKLLNTFSLIIGLLFAAFAVRAQDLQKAQSAASLQKNYSCFSKSSKKVSPELNLHTSSRNKSHPEYGVLPYNAGCTDCYEELDKRTETTRTFIKEGSKGSAFYVQQSYYPMHYYDENNELLTIDSRLHPASQSNVYVASQQLNAAKLDLTDGHTELRANDFDLVFNNNMKYEYEEVSDGKDFGFFNAAQSSVGDDGSITTNAWAGVDRRVTFGIGAVKTDFVIYSKPDVNTNSGFLSFSETITLPEKYKIMCDSAKGTFTKDGFWIGDLILINDRHEELFRFVRPAIYNESKVKNDSALRIPKGLKLPDTYQIAYKLDVRGSAYTIKIVVPACYFNYPDIVYPVTIDPLVTGTNTTAFAGVGQCTSYSVFAVYPAPENSVMVVAVPGNSTITGLTYTIQYTALANGCPCAGGAASNKNCIVTDGFFRLSGPCGLGAGPYTLTCPGLATRVACTNWIVTSVPIADNATVSCIAPQCANYSISLTMNMFRAYCACSPACGTNCIRFNQWSATISAHTLETLGDAATGNGSSTINGSCNVNSTLDPAALYGVPAYTYSWAPGGATTSTLVANQSTNGSYVYTATITDACGIARTATFTFNIADCPLPVHLLYNTAVCDGSNTIIKWETASETNNDYFSIEKSTDAIAYRDIAKIQGAGNSTSKKEYQYKDIAANAQPVYYRLSQTDYNGAKEIFPVIYSNCISNTTCSVSAFNNQQGAIEIDIKSPAGNEFTATLFDDKGTKISAKQFSVSKGNNINKLDISTLASGIYIMLIDDGKETTIKKIMVR